MAAARFFPLLLILVVLAAAAAVPVTAIENKCGACIVVAKELMLVLADERLRNHLDMRNRLNSEGKREGRMIDYRVSELRAVEILDGFCKKMDKYALLEMDDSKRRLWSTWRNYAPRANTDTKKLIREEQGKEIKRWCERLLEDKEDEITAALLSGELNVESDASSILCTRVSSSCKAKTIKKEVKAVEEAASGPYGGGRMRARADHARKESEGLVDVTDDKDPGLVVSGDDKEVREEL